MFTYFQASSSHYHNYTEVFLTANDTLCCFLRRKSIEEEELYGPSPRPLISLMVSVDVKHHVYLLTSFVVSLP